MKLSTITLTTLALALLGGTAAAQLSGEGSGARRLRIHKLVGEVSEATPMVISPNEASELPKLVRVRLQSLGSPAKVSLLAADGRILDEVILAEEAELKPFVMRAGEEPVLVIDDIPPSGRKRPIFSVKGNAQLGSQQQGAGAQGWGSCGGGVEPPGIVVKVKVGGLQKTAVASVEFEEVDDEPTLPRTGAKMNGKTQVAAAGFSFRRARHNAGGSMGGKTQTAADGFTFRRARYNAGGSMSGKTEVAAADFGIRRARYNPHGSISKNETQAADGLSAEPPSIRRARYNAGGSMSGKTQTAADGFSLRRARYNAGGSMSGKTEVAAAGYSIRRARYNPHGGVIKVETQSDSDGLSAEPPSIRRARYNAGGEVSKTAELQGAKFNNRKLTHTPPSSRG